MSATERPVLSRDLIAATALRITDEDGLAGLSMRKLGAELGVEAMSLYHYVENKDDLLDAVVDRLYAEIALPRDVPDDRWEEAVSRAMHALHDVLVGHAAALELLLTRPVRTAESFEVMYWAYRRFEVMGLEPGDAVEAFRLAVSFVMGHVASEQGVMALARRTEGIDPDDLPTPEMRRFALELRAATSDQLFGSGVAMVIAGLKSRFTLP